MPLGRGQCEYLNVLCLLDGSRWHLVTFEDPDFDPGFATELPASVCHVLQIAVFADNFNTLTRSLVAEAHSDSGEVTLRLE